MSRDSSHTYIHLHESRFADLCEEFTRSPHLPDEVIYVPPQHLPLNPEDEDDVVPDQHAAFGIQKAIQPDDEPAWQDLGLMELLEKVPPNFSSMNVKNHLKSAGGHGFGANKMPR